VQWTPVTLAPPPIDCQWSEWGNWSVCSVTCAAGTQTRSRTSTPAQYQGNACIGPSSQVESCTMVPCPINCEWSAWSYVSCPVTCGGGHDAKIRSPSILPRWGGLDCPGASFNTSVCNDVPCPIDCDWDEWTEWSTCNVPCGHGNKSRTRVGSPAEYGGSCPDTRDIDFTGCTATNCFPGLYSKGWVIAIIVLTAFFALTTLILLAKVLTTPATNEGSSTNTYGQM